MKEIIISDDQKVTSDIIGDLCQINLLNDVVICCPYWEEQNDDILYDIDEFLFFNRNDIRPNGLDHYVFFPRIKMTVPEGIIVTSESKIKGLSVIDYTIEKYKGINLNTQASLDDMTINISAVEGTYNIYYKFEYILKEYNREMFLNEIKIKNTLIKIPKRSSIIGSYLVESFVGVKKRDLGEIYLIRSDALYKNFPNFSG